ncbi:unnamed protein product [Urochloa decumbens]|uniref:F-box domain-containing protein n=1 Tax=Urochloa decumbens TaxID=240449 RepID=A0ABC9H0H8_9POAL
MPHSRVSFCAHPAMDVMNDDGLVLILERVDSHVSLIRAAAVCRRWRRVIADAAFLRRYRSHHAPAVAGYYHNPSPSTIVGVNAGTVRIPVFVPSSPSRVDSHQFSLDFLPGGAESWSVWESRGTLLVLLDMRFGRAFPVPDFAICEPLTQRYAMIPPHPTPDSDSWGPFLLDGEADEVGCRFSMSNFRLLRMFNHNGVTLTSIFTTGSSWSEKNIDPMVPGIGPDIRSPAILGRASGSVYFYINDGSRTLISLDGSTGVFSFSGVLPASENWDVHAWRYNRVLTEGSDGKPRIVIAFDGAMKVFARLDSTEWALEKMIQLSEAASSLPGYPSSFLGHNISTMGVGFVILSQRVVGIAEQWPFSVSLETMEASPAANNVGQIAYQCERPWPPALHACLDR